MSQGDQVMTLPCPWGASCAHCTPLLGDFLMATETPPSATHADGTFMQICETPVNGMKPCEECHYLSSL